MGKKVVKAKWVLRRKLLPGGKLDKLKARIVAKGFTQREGIDYEETFSPTVRFESVRLMAAAAAVGNMHTHQMDVTTAFLYASLDEEVYMELVRTVQLCLYTSLQLGLSTSSTILPLVCVYASLV